MHTRLSIVLGLFPLSLAACSSPAPTAPTTDAGPTDAASTDAAMNDGGDASSVTPDGSAACNALANTAAVVPVDQIAREPPTLSGGAIADGTYALTALAIYTGPSGPTGATGTTQTTITIAGSALEVVSTGSPATRTVTLTTSGDSFTATDTCPDTTTIQGTYAATATTFTVAFSGGTDDAGARTVVETFTKE